MTFKTIVIGFSGSMALLTGCQSPMPPPQPQPIQSPVQVVVRETPPPEPVPRMRTVEQIQLLRDFAMKESPQISKTIQQLNGEISDSIVRLKKLRAEMLEFDRNPDADEDYKALKVGLRELQRAYDAIFDKLEDAYIAAKKYEASPSRKDYHEMMKRAFEDGVQDANMATERYKEMTRQK